MEKRFLRLALAAALLVCSLQRVEAQQAAAKKNSPDIAAPFPEQAERRELFKELVAATRKYHVFIPQTEKNLGRRWSDDLPLLEKEFLAADTRDKLVAALAHFQNSLHNPHCTFLTPRRPQALSAGFRAGVEWERGKPVFWVENVSDAELRKSLEPGDLILSMDGLSAREFIKKLLWESNANSLHGVANAIAWFLGSRLSGYHGVKEGQTTSWTFRKRDSGKIVHLVTRWSPRRRDGEGGRGMDDDFGVDYQSKSCAGLPDRHYGPYTLKEMGINYCLYVSEVAPYDAYPVVRHFSFMYSGSRSPYHPIRVEHRLLTRHLAALPRARGVILDLRDNHGGNNPNWFFDWWAPAPYYDHFSYVRAHPDLADQQRLEEADITGWGPDDNKRYVEALKRLKPGQQFLPRRPFFCKPNTCDWDNRYEPAHQVTKLPVALLVGPECVSSCDEFAQIFNENHFGPLIGEHPASAFTSFRMRYQVTTPRTHLRLGNMSFAFSKEVSGKTGKNVEAARLKIDYPVDRSFKNRERYDELLVDAARRAFGGYKFHR